MIKSIFISGIFLFAAGLSVSCSGEVSGSERESKEVFNKFQKSDTSNMEKATFGAGCFWCVEAVFQRLKGVKSVKPGYSGGDVKNPSYKEVCTGRTGHAEVIQVEFDPEVISYDELLEVFWKTHDPTTLNRQGNDVGTQYRSVVFYHNDEQKTRALHYKQKLDEADIFDDSVVTEISQFDKFYVAEEDHFNYYNENKDQPYCSVVITPKIKKLERIFEDKLK